MPSFPDSNSIEVSDPERWGSGSPENRLAERKRLIFTSGMWDDLPAIDRDPTREVLRRFGMQILLGFLFAGFFWVLLLRLITGHWHWEIGVFLLGIGIVVFTTSYCFLAPGRWFYLFWQHLTRCLEVSIGFLVLSGIFYLVLTPIGLIRRHFGKSPLVKSPEPDSPSYWIEVQSEEHPDPAAYFRQF